MARQDRTSKPGAGRAAGSSALCCALAAIRTVLEMLGLVTLSGSQLVLTCPALPRRALHPSRHSHLEPLAGYPA